MSIIVVLQGLPGSGKSSWAKEFCKKHKEFIRVNRDDLRNMRGEYWVPQQEELITKLERACVGEALKKGYSVILDSTNLNPKFTKQFEEEFKGKAKIEKKFFECEVEECIKRDLQRPNSVGEKVIRDMYEKYLAPQKVVYKEDRTLPKAVIVDIDGTVATMVGRGPFEFHLAHTDAPKENVVQLVKNLQIFGYEIIFVSGRDSVCRKITLDWLSDTFYWNPERIKLFMRPEKDVRKDSIVKKELFETNIRGKYYVELVLDDRDQVVEMWRKGLGLTCLQVDYGNF